MAKKGKMKKTRAKAGQPTKYKPEFCEKLIKHFDIEPWEEREIPHYKGGEVVWTDIKILPVRMPTLRGFAKKIKVGIRTVYDWIDKKHGSHQEEFSHAFTYAKDIRKDWLVDLGLSGSAPPASFKFVAVNVTEMRDKQEMDLGLNKDTITLLGLIDGSSKGKLPNRQEEKDAG